MKTTPIRPSETPTEEAPRERRLQVPAALLFQMVDALRATDRDTRRVDVCCTTESHGMVSDACDAWNRHQDARLRSGGRA